MNSNISFLHVVLLQLAVASMLSKSHSFLLRPSTFFHFHHPSTSALNGGVGVANTYSWTEEQFEIEVKLSVPPRTSTKDVKFKCSSNSIDLRLLNNCNGNIEKDEKILLNGSRQTRGKICMDGTFWSIDGPNNDTKNRTITITIEKHFVPISSSGGTLTYDTLTDFDWGGLYPNDEDEVISRKYDEAEELNVREYAQKLGVDIDNIDMNKVNRTMFGAGLADQATNALGGFDESDGMQSSNGKGFHFNITQSTLDQLTKVGLAKEVIQQSDGKEYELGQDSALSEENIFSMLGKDITNDELREAGIVGDIVKNAFGTSASSIPEMFEQQTVPVEEAPGYRETYDGGSDEDGIIKSEIVEREVIASSGKNDDVAEVKNVATQVEDELNNEGEEEEGASATTKGAQDPIDLLTVSRLKEILKYQGLKVSGTKQVLRDRLKDHVNTLMQDE